MNSFARALSQAKIRETSEIACNDDFARSCSIRNQTEAVEIEDEVETGLFIGQNMTKHVILDGYWIRGEYAIFFTLSKDGTVFLELFTFNSLNGEDDENPKI